MLCNWRPAGKCRSCSGGGYQLVIFTPEMMIEHKRWRKMLLGEVYTSRLRAFVVDEAHTVKKWLAGILSAF